MTRIIVSEECPDELGGSYSVRDFVEMHMLNSRPDGYAHQFAKLLDLLVQKRMISGIDVLSIVGRSDVYHSVETDLDDMR